LAKAVGDLLALDIVKNKITPNHLQLRNNVQRAIADLANGNQLLFCRAAKIDGKTLIEWLNGNCLPSLPLLIRLSQNLRLPMSRLLLEEISATDPICDHARRVVEAEQAAIASSRTSRLRPEYPITRGRLWALSSQEREACRAEIKAAMESALEQNVSRSVHDLVRSLGHRNCCMARYWFPELCAAITAKRKQRFDGYKHELRTALSEEPPPTVVQVAQRLGISHRKLRRSCPDLCTALSLRFPDRRRFQSAKTKDALKKALEEPPVPLTTLASRLCRDANKMRVAFPDICRRLRDRYTAHRASEFQKIRLTYEEPVRQAITEITAAGKYPSGKRVLSVISKANPALTSIFLTGHAVKHALEELRKLQP
jgi:transcriptional regulator with XRE-family HTH domain